jgi:hypothetical protein
MLAQARQVGATTEQPTRPLALRCVALRCVALRCVALRGSGVHDRVSSRPYKREKERPLALATGVPVLPRHGLRHPQRQAERRRPLLDMCDLRLVLGDYVHDLAVVTLAGPMRRDGERDEKPAAAPRGDRLPTSSIS